MRGAVLRLLETSGGFGCNTQSTILLKTQLLPKALIVRNVNQNRTLTATSHRLAESSSTDRLYTEKHEWIAVNSQKVGTVGISAYAAEKLGDVVYVELPTVGARVAGGEAVGAIESVKSASDIYSPVSGTIAKANSTLDEKPFLINKSTYDKGWIYKINIDNESDLKTLMNETSYKKFCDEEENSDTP